MPDHALCTPAPLTGALLVVQAMGAIPVTSRHPNSSLPEVCAGFDLGPPVPPGVASIQAETAWMDAWEAALVTAATASPESLQAHRRQMAREARTRFAWSTVVNAWHEAFGGEGVEPSSGGSALPPDELALQMQSSYPPDELVSTDGLALINATVVATLPCTGEAAVSHSFGHAGAISGRRFPPLSTIASPPPPASPVAAASSRPASLAGDSAPTPPGPASRAERVRKDGRARDDGGGGTGRAGKGKASKTAGKGKASKTTRQKPPSAMASADGTRADGCRERGSAEERFAAGQASYQSGDVQSAYACFHSAATANPGCAAI